MASRSMPPLNALRAFEAAARHLSFSKAANELSVTPAALSHQIRGLEEFLQCKLFHRLTRAVELTEAGQLIYPGLNSAFQTMRAALNQLQHIKEDRVLVVSAGPAFTAKWLAPRLHQFMAAFPDLELRIAANLARSDFKTDGVDMAIRFGSGDYAGMLSEKLFDEKIMPMCAPALLDGEPGPLDGKQGLRSVKDLTRATLIHDDSLSYLGANPGWKEWLEMAGGDDIDVTRGLRFNQADHALDAAIDGTGVVMGRKLIADGDLRAGRLVAPFGQVLCIRQAFYLVYPKESHNLAKVRSFRKWILAEVSHLNDENDR